jgi:hypothetical protein
MRKFLIPWFLVALLSFGVHAAQPAATEDKPAAAAPKTKAEMKKEARAQYKAAIAKANEDYKAASAECGKKQGADKKSCTKEAKEARNKAVAEAKRTYGIPDPAAPPLEGRVF